MSQNRRVVSLIIESLTLFFLSWWLLDLHLTQINNTFQWFFTSLIIITVAKYVDYPWFTTPADCISISLLLSGSLLIYTFGLEPLSWSHYFINFTLILTVGFSIISIFNGLVNRESKIRQILYNVFFKHIHAEAVFALYSSSLAITIFGASIIETSEALTIVLIAFIGPVGKAIESWIPLRLAGYHIGLISSGSGIGRVFVRILKRDYFRIGDILSCTEQGKNILLQVIGAKTYEQESQKGIIELESTVLGEQRQEGEEKKFKIYPYLESFVSGSKVTKIHRAKLPNYLHFAGTNIEVNLVPNELITHNTAIIGTLGSGKTRFAMQLVDECLKNVDDLLVICFDVTNEWSGLDINKLRKEECKVWMDSAVKSLAIDRKIKEKVPYPADVEILRSNGGNEKPNLEEFRIKIKEFYDNAIKSKGLYIINVGDLFLLRWAKTKERDTKGNYYKVPEEMTLPQIVSELVLEGYRRFRDLSKQAKLLFIFEEAHSLVPEVSGGFAFDDDKVSALHTARVIMQGRKFGLGCFVISQRTASVSKSLLTQCNTVFALQQFDNTGIDYFGNYFGETAKQLPFLEERQALCLGKGIRRTAPIIVRSGDVTLKEESPNDF